MWVCVRIQTVEIRRHKKKHLCEYKHTFGQGIVWLNERADVFLFYFLNCCLKEWYRHRSKRKKQACRFLMRICLAVYDVRFSVCVCMSNMNRRVPDDIFANAHTLIVISLHSIVYTHTVFLLFFFLSWPSIDYNGTYNLDTMWYNWFFICSFLFFFFSFFFLFMVCVILF